MTTTQLQLLLLTLSLTLTVSIKAYPPPTVAPILLSLGTASSTISLLPGTTITTLPFNGLKPNHYYELRVNWPATHPGKFTLWIDHNKDTTLPPALEATTTAPLRRRTLLNAHKEIFQYQEFSKEKLSKQRVQTYGHVRVEKEGISWDVAIENRPVLFNLILEEVYFGVLPKSTVPLVVCLVFCIVMGLLFVVPRIELYLQLHNNKEIKNRR